MIVFFGCLVFVSDARRTRYGYGEIEEVQIGSRSELSETLSKLLLASRGIAGAPRTRPERPLARQSLGQNFLEDTLQAKRFTDALGGNDDSMLGMGGTRVIELGPGQGALTKHLVQAYPNMTAIEIDKRMVEVLREAFPMLEVQNMDLLKADFGKLGSEKEGKLSLIGNMPFYLTSQFLFKMLGAVEHIDHVVVSMQLEVAQKILSPHGNKRYGILSVMLQLFGRPRHLFDIPSDAFSPAPKCTVAVVRFDPSAVPEGASAPLSKRTRKRLLGLLKLVFEQRRKMLRKSLGSLVQQAHTPVPADILTKRPEQLAPHEFLELADLIFGPDEASDESLARISATQTHEGWVPHKAGWM